MDRLSVKGSSSNDKAGVAEWSEERVSNGADSFSSISAHSKRSMTLTHDVYTSKTSCYKVEWVPYFFCRLM